MRLIKTKASAWAGEMEWEAAHRGLNLEFEIFWGSVLVAHFSNAEFYCYSREWTP